MVWSPATTMFCTWHSAIECASSGRYGSRPTGVDDHDTDANRRSKSPANTCAARRPLWCSMFTANMPDDRSTPSVRLRLVTQTSSSGGSKETEHSDEQVSPNG